MNHTPGPWTATPCMPRIQYWICGGSRIVAKVPGECEDAVTAANARLIAAAPDMLEALEELGDITPKVKAAIAKAVG